MQEEIPVPEISEVEIFREVCENDFAFYAKQMLKVVEPETEFEWNWHLEILCHWCERVYYGHEMKLDINIPPRTLKSLIVSVLFPTWVWTKNPSCKFLCASASYDLATKFNMKRRDLLESKEYFSLWPIALKDDSNTAMKFENYSNGMMQAVSAGGKITGAGADIQITDDLLDANDAFSDTKRQTVVRWYSSVFYGRVQNRKTIKRININQRLHQQDVSATLIAKHKFKSLIIPMEMTEKQLSTVDFVDPRKQGEFIHPTRYSHQEYEDDKLALGTYGASAQLQQSPTPIGGGIIKNEWIRYYNPATAPAYERKIITADLTFKGEEHSDFVSFMCWGKSGKDKYLIDVVRGKWTYKVTKEKFKEFCEKHNASTKYIEDKANGPALISDMQSDIYGIQSWPEKGSPYMQADKVQRLLLVSQEFENGHVYLPEGLVLVEVFVAELTSFTEKGSGTGKDDMVDTSTMALLELKKSKTFFAG